MATITTYLLEEGPDILATFHVCFRDTIFTYTNSFSQKKQVLKRDYTFHFICKKCDLVFHYLIFTRTMVTNDLLVLSSVYEYSQSQKLFGSIFQKFMYKILKHSRLQGICQTWMVYFSDCSLIFNSFSLVFHYPKTFI